MLEIAAGVSGKGRVDDGGQLTLMSKLRVLLRVRVSLGLPAWVVLWLPGFPPACDAQITQEHQLRSPAISVRDKLAVASIVLAVLNAFQDSRSGEFESARGVLLLLVLVDDCLYAVLLRKLQPSPDGVVRDADCRSTRSCSPVLLLEVRIALRNLTEVLEAFGVAFAM